jgi:hypothetical protein
VTETFQMSQADVAGDRFSHRRHGAYRRQQPDRLHDQPPV